MSEKQQTLGAFGSTKTLIHQDEKVNTDIPNTVNLNYTEDKCDNCGKRFKNNQGYGLHKLISKKNKHCKQFS